MQATVEHEPWFLSKMLGPLHKMWTRWSPAQERFMAFDADHFIKTMRHQVDELQEILDEHGGNPVDRTVFSKEFVDCISVGLNGLRWANGNDPSKVVKAIDDRNSRYADVHGIIDHYVDMGWG